MRPAGVNSWHAALLEEADQRWPKWSALIRLRLRQGRGPEQLAADILGAYKALPAQFVIVAEAVILAAMEELGNGEEGSGRGGDPPGANT